LSSAEPADVPFVRSVFHPSDFSPISEAAFAHALAIALVRETKLTILHAGSNTLTAEGWTRFPAVRSTLERWGLLEKDSPRSAVFERFAVQVSKVAVKNRDPARAALDYVSEHEPHLIVVGTEGREGLPAWLSPSVASEVARRSRTMTLFVPAGARGFVSAETGVTSLRRILLPVDHEPNPQAAAVYASRAAEALGDHPVAITLLHVGQGETPSVDVPQNEFCTWSTEKRSGDPVDEILRAAKDVEADLIIMATAGREGVLEALRGSVTERVVRGAPCPLLAIPAA
jgi:nucleotide-binding universal stress UspA family protein